MLADIIEFALDGAPARSEDRELPDERFIHAAIYEARRDVKAVLHASPEDILPFGITQTPLRPVIASVGDMGLHVPVWDIAKKFGRPQPVLQVSTLEQGRDLARCLGKNRVVLLRGAGFIVTGRTLNDVVRLSAYIPRNGRAIMDGRRRSAEIKCISAGEVRRPACDRPGVERHAARLGILGAAGRLRGTAGGLAALAAPGQGLYDGQSPIAGKIDCGRLTRSRHCCSAVSCRRDRDPCARRRGLRFLQGQDDQSLIAGFPPGGGYDTYVRMLARHYGRFIPGQPLVVASNMPGAGSLTAANQIYNKATPDGLVARDVRLVGRDGAAARQQGGAVRRHQVQLDRQHVERRRLLRRLAGSPGIPATFDEMLSKETIFGGGARGGDHLPAPDGAQERAARQYQGHPGLCRNA